jgi:hypothetical protein
METANTANRGNHVTYPLSEPLTAPSLPPLKKTFATRCPAELKRTHRSIARVLMRGEPLANVFVVTRVIKLGPHRYSQY